MARKPSRRGIGAGIQTVATFVPIMFAMFLALASGRLGYGPRRVRDGPGAPVYRFAGKGLYSHDRGFAVPYRPSWLPGRLKTNGIGT